VLLGQKLRIIQISPWIAFLNIPTFRKEKHNQYQSEKAYSSRFICAEDI
jgi:hypothetical protein